MTHYEEIFRIKERMRAYEMHDPWCDRFKDLEHQKSTTVGLVIRDCNCWLVKE